MAVQMSSTPMLRCQSNVRLVIEAACSCCGPIHNAPAGLEAIEAASAHTAESGHVVILNGTVDRPELEEPERPS
jgi:hypothetical protein